MLDLAILPFIFAIISELNSRSTRLVRLHIITAKIHTQRN